MQNELILEFPKFITHIPVNRNKFIKIGLNKIYTGVHFSARSSLVSAMHGYIEKHIPENLKIEGPVETELIVYCPINYGTVKLVKNKEGSGSKIQWKAAEIDYQANWDIGNLAMIWLKCLDDVIVKKKILADDTVMYFTGGAFKFQPIDNLEDRKLVYKIKTINNDGL